MTSRQPSRLAYIDWMRGLACVLMFQTHCYDSWLSHDARQSRFFMWSQLGGTFPAPLFLFLAGLSVSLVVDKSHRAGMTPAGLRRMTIRRGAEILALGLLFRLQEYVIALGWAPWTDLFRVDILNTIGISIMLMGAMCWLVLWARPGRYTRAWLAGSASAIAMLIALVTPPLWTSWQPRWLPWPLESYINGVHNLGTPQAWLFPIFPWSGFAFAGLAVGFVLWSDWSRRHPGQVIAAAAAFGAALIAISRWLDNSPYRLYSTYDYWHTSPNFFSLRLGALLILLFAAYVWCQWGWGSWGFSPLVQLGQTSLLVYWVHIEFVYGRFSILTKNSQTIASASFGLLEIFLAMLLLSFLRTRLKRAPLRARVGTPA
jgi:uncharacterized membrane protein